MSLSFRYWINPNYPSVSTEDPTPDCSVSSKSRPKASRIHNCLKKVRQLVSTRSSFVASLFGRGKATKFVTPAVSTGETQGFTFDFVPAAETYDYDEFSPPLVYDVVGVDSSSDSSSAADEDSTTLSLPLASLFFFEDVKSALDVESPAKKMKKAVEQEDCKTERRVWENASVEEETEFFEYYINKVYKDPEAIMAGFPDGRLAEWNRLLAGAKKIGEIQTRRRNCRYGGRRTHSFCFSLHNTPSSYSSNSAGFDNLKQQSSISHKLSGLQDLYDCMDKLLQLNQKVSEFEEACEERQSRSSSRALLKAGNSPPRHLIDCEIVTLLREAEPVRVAALESLLSFIFGQSTGKSSESSSWSIVSKLMRNQKRVAVEAEDEFGCATWKTDEEVQFQLKKLQAYILRS
ncbi:unnamed protein product [Linum tenue]|uniref:Uncharacterized protein n=1 Tax=Linum tenue TaxID=586396 RepID=A0AAV0JD14_9ROSI|nr:unnamed protein product [Linum tenue]